jgi:type II secretory pathway pseudopilin PulG
VTRRGGNDEIRMSNDECSRGVCIKRLTNETGFTLIELIVVTAVIIILTGLVLSTVGYVQKKAARARAETEIAAMSAACENYKADNGIYPRDTTNHTTDNLAALTDPNYATRNPPDPAPTSYDPQLPHTRPQVFIFILNSLETLTAIDRR